MPPVASAAIAKTQRSHEENQERAYIAASRRSDRSLEARIESARRASRIHKNRTGRALCITEEAVANEQMYEEEDDDLPTQYLRLSAHLRTSSAEFNRKLHAYIATQKAGRDALTLYSNAPHFAPQAVPQPQAQPQIPHPQMDHQSPQSFCHTPYLGQPQLHQHQQSYQHQHPYNPYQFQQNLHQSYQTQQHQQQQRSLSFAASSGPPFSNAGLPTAEDQPQRRMSMPAQAKAQPLAPWGMTAQTDISTDSRNSSPPYTDVSSPYSIHTPSTISPTMIWDSDVASAVSDSSPFSITLPPETQQMIGLPLDQNHLQTPIYPTNCDPALLSLCNYYQFGEVPPSASFCSNPAPE